MGWWVGGLYVHTLVKNLLIKFLMLLFLVAKGCKFDSCIVALIMCLPAKTTPIYKSTLEWLELLL